MIPGFREQKIPYQVRDGYTAIVLTIGPVRWDTQRIHTRFRPCAGCDRLCARNA